MTDEKPKRKKYTKNGISDFWYDNYLNKGHCGLCGNSGVIDTTGTYTAAGFECGGIFWCVCPNGRAYAKEYGTKGPTVTTDLHAGKRKFLEIMDDLMKKVP